MVGIQNPGVSIQNGAACCMGMICDKRRRRQEVGAKGWRDLADKLSVLIMGAGRMGEILAASIGKSHEVAIYDQDQDKGRRVAKRLHCRYGSPEGFIPGAGVLILALPPAVTATALWSVRELLAADTVVINIATTIAKSDLRPALAGKGHLVGAKIVGHFLEMDQRPAIVIDADTEKGRQTASLLFSNLGLTLTGDEGQVQLINTVAAREAFRAAFRIREALEKAGVSPDLIASALRVVAPGSIKAYAEGDLGPFARKLLAEIDPQDIDPGEIFISRNRD